MNRAHYLLPDLKIIEEDHLVLGRGKIWSAAEDLGIPVRHLLSRPVWDFEIEVPGRRLEQILFSVPCRIDENIKNHLSFCFETSTDFSSDAYILEVSRPCILNFAEATYQVNEGSFFF